MKKQFLAPFLVLLLLLAGTTLVILYGKGYRIGTISNGRPTISKTGLLVAKSTPDGAQVFINGNLTTATDDTIDLIPGEYTVKITKDGYFPWEKKVRIEKEVVTKAEALLLTTAPRLENITSSGVSMPVLDPSGKRLAFRIASQSAKKNGIYILDLSTTLVLTLQSSAKQIADDITAAFSTATYEWTPDGEQLITSVTAEDGSVSTYLLKTAGFNDAPQNVTAILPNLQEQWILEKQEKELARLNGLKKEVKTLISTHFTTIAWSPDETKILYVASESAELPFIIKPRRIGINVLQEDRKLHKGDVYVYDIQDDINFKVLSSTDEGTTPSIQWFPDSYHLVTVRDKKIDIMELDGTNSTTIYAGPFMENYVFPWSNGSKIVILTNFNNQGVPPNLYTVGLK